ncbi:MAG TPA: hypothetical protein VEL51_10125 [Vicinamibacterales bacterium]|nr:hypothetical protein [Vicinamibacterales bacterium]
MEKTEAAPAPEPDRGDVTPPHGDEIVNRQRNMSRHATPPPADPDNDRPAD